MADVIEVVEPEKEVVVEEVVVPVETPAPSDKAIGLESALVAERRKRQEAKEEAAYWKGVAESKTQPPPQPVEPKNPQPPVRPAKLNSEQFETWAEYEAAQTKQDDEYLAKRDEFLLEKFKFEQIQNEQKRSHEQTQKEKIAAHLERLRKATELDPEIQDIADSFHLPGKYQMTLSTAMQEAILESEVGPEILRHLYNNKQDAAKIARLGQVAAVREMLKIETELSKPKNAVKQVSSAPPPITPVRPTGAVEVDDDLRPAADVIREMREKSFKRR